MSCSMSEKHAYLCDIQNLWYIVLFWSVRLEIWDIALYSFYNFIMKHIKQNFGIRQVDFQSDHAITYL